MRGPVLSVKKTQFSLARSSKETTTSSCEHESDVAIVCRPLGTYGPPPFLRMASRTKASIGSICLTVSTNDWRIAAGRRKPTRAAQAPQPRCQTTREKLDQPVITPPGGSGSSATKTRRPAARASAIASTSSTNNVTASSPVSRGPVSARAAAARPQLVIKPPEPPSRSVTP
jgi:hypothetical protein